MIRRFVKDWIPNVAQLILVVLVLPLLCYILSLFSDTQDMAASCMNLIGEIPVIGDVGDLLATLIGIQDHTMGAGFEVYAEYLVSYIDTMGSMIYELVSVALCVKICVIVSDILKMRGVHLLASVLGVFLGCYVSKIYDLSALAIGFLMILVMVVDMIFLRKPGFNLLSFLIDYLKFTLELTADVLSLIFVVGFVLMLLTIWMGNALNIIMVLTTILMFVVPWFLIASLKRYVLSI